MSKTPKILVYITRDIERALGKTPDETYRIITNRTPYAESVAAQYPAWISLISGPGMLDTAELMEHEVTLEMLSHIEADIVVFKNYPLVEELAQKHGWNLLNPSAILAEKVENKLTQIEWLGEIGKEWLPPHKIQITKEIVWENQPVIIQWAHGHTGDSTISITSEKELKEVQAKFPDRTARVSSYINGSSFTVNVVISPSAILLGNISYQITGMEPFTTRPFTTVGNDWTLSADLLDDNELAEMAEMAALIGKKLRGDGWKGLFGLDFMRDLERNRLFLIEINARQPASTTFESQLQKMNQELGLDGETIFSAHLYALQGTDSPQPLMIINDGAQIIQRITESKKTISEKEIAALNSSGYTTITYNNTSPNSDLLRIQSLKGIMESHNKFNSRGTEISVILSK